MVGEKHLQGKHGQALMNGNPEAPLCYECHTHHYVKPKVDPKCSIYPDKLAQVCLPLNQKWDGATGVLHRAGSNEYLTVSEFQSYYSIFVE